jgi:CBS domain-containing protein
MMENIKPEDVQNEICDEDVAAALRELKLSLNLSADDLKKILSSACRHARSRSASGTRVRDAMTRNVIAISKFDEISRAVKIMAEKGVSGLPVVDRENKVVGIISEADVVSMVGDKRKNTFRLLLKHLMGEPLPERKIGDFVGDIMTSPAVTIQPDADLSDAVGIMDEYRIRRLAVVDKDQRLLGLISRADIVRTIGRAVQQSCG